MCSDDLGLSCTHFCMAAKDKAKQGLDITFAVTRC
jgi:hypothetical protein